MAFPNGGQDLDEALSTFSLGFFASRAVLTLGAFLRGGRKPEGSDELLGSVQKLMAKYESLGAQPQEDEVVDAALETVEGVQRFSLALAGSAGIKASALSESERQLRKHAERIRKAAARVQKLEELPKEQEPKRMLPDIRVIRDFFSHLSSMCTAEPDESFVVTEGRVAECLPLT